MIDESKHNLDYLLGTAASNKNTEPLNNDEPLTHHIVVTIHKISFNWIFLWLLIQDLRVLNNRTLVNKELSELVKDISETSKDLSDTLSR